jgi:hypothetical protein
MVEEMVVEIEEGRHPVIDLLMEGEQFVANDTNLSVSVHSVIDQYVEPTPLASLEFAIMSAITTTSCYECIITAGASVATVPWHQ